jgi:hypothetical protein
VNFVEHISRLHILEAVSEVVPSGWKLSSKVVALYTAPIGTVPLLPNAMEDKPEAADPAIHARRCAELSGRLEAESGPHPDVGDKDGKHHITGSARDLVYLSDATCRIDLNEYWL